MNDEQSKRLSDAADALMTASDALEEARDTLADTRFDSQVERERISAAQQMSQKLENAGKRIEEAVRKGTIAAAALARAGSYQRYRDATTAAREGRSLARVANEQDGTANKRAKGQESLEKLEAALTNAAAIVFGE
jgi:hypothetical protein